MWGRLLASQIYLESSFCVYHPLLSSTVYLIFTSPSILFPTLFRLVEFQALPTIFTACFALPSSTIWTSKHHVPRVLARCHCGFLPSSLSPILGSLLPKGRSGGTDTHQHAKLPYDSRTVKPRAHVLFGRTEMPANTCRDTIK
jgi:hypothetical protein